MTVVSASSFNDVPALEAALARTAAHVRQSRRISYMISGWIAEQRLDVQHGGTACCTIGIPDDFYAVRLGFANCTGQPWHLSKVIGAPGPAFGDFVHPDGHPEWVRFQPGSQSGSSARGDGSIAVAGLPPHGAGQAGAVQWTWTDWAPIASAPVKKPSDLRPLFLRALIPSNQTVSFAVGQLRTLLGNTEVNQGFEVFIGGIKFDLDLTGDDKGGGPTVTWIDNQLVAGSLFPMVQVLTRHRGVVGLVAGDSHQQGTSTLEQFTGFAYRASVETAMRYAGNVPVGIVNAAVGGLTTPQIFGRFHDLLDEIAPTYAVLPGWTYNDDGPQGRADHVAVRAFLARLLRAVSECESRGILPVICTPFPRDAARMGTLQVGPWRWIRERILELGADDRVLVIDATSVLGHREAGKFNGTYDPAMSTDQAHPDDAGHAAVARLLRPFLDAACRQKRVGTGDG